MVGDEFTPPLTSAHMRGITPGAPAHSGNAVGSQASTGTTMPAQSAKSGPTSNREFDDWKTSNRELVKLPTSNREFDDWKRRTDNEAAAVLVFSVSLSGRQYAQCW